jgi:hypothetical protein
MMAIANPSIMPVSSPGASKDIRPPVIFSRGWAGNDRLPGLAAVVIFIVLANASLAAVTSGMDAWCGAASSGGTASFTIGSIAYGTHTYTATYSGTGSAAASSATVTVAAQ